MLLKMTGHSLAAGVVLGLLLFLPAGTLAWPQAWVFMALFIAFYSVGNPLWLGWYEIPLFPLYHILFLSGAAWLGDRIFWIGSHGRNRDGKYRASRHRFFAVRILGEVTPERLSILREADTIVQSEMKASDWYFRVWQSFAVLLPVRSVGVMGDQRTYENTIVLRIVESQDGMTADWVRLPYELLARISSRISNEVKGVNRVCYDISSKPPSTIEWE